MKINQDKAMLMIEQHADTLNEPLKNWYVDQVDNARDLLRDPFFGDIDDDGMTTIANVDALIHDMMEQATLFVNIEQTVKSMRGELCDYIVFNDDLGGYVCMLVESQTEVLLTLSNIPAPVSAKE